MIHRGILFLSNPTKRVLDIISLVYVTHAHAACSRPAAGAVGDPSRHIVLQSFESSILGANIFGSDLQQQSIDTITTTTSTTTATPTTTTAVLLLLLRQQQQQTTTTTSSSTTTTGEVQPTAASTTAVV